MREYVKPIVLAENEIAEGIYAASGATSSDCWTVDVTIAQRNAGGYNNYRVSASHSDSMEHISTKTVVTVVFNQTVNWASYEGFDVSVSGNVVTLTRESHANAYVTGDNFNSLLMVSSDDLDTLNVESAGITCTHAENVQGKYD